MSTMNIVWTAVIATVAAAGSVVAAVFSATDISISLGFVAVTSALLAARER